MLLAIDDISGYLDNGFITTSALTAEDVERVLADADRLQSEAAALEHSTGDFNLEAPDGGYRGQDGTETAYRGLLRKVSNTAAHSDAVLEISRRPALTDLALRLLGDVPCELAHSVLWFKPPKVGSPKPPHQDAPYLAGDATRYVTFWFALDPSTVDNGCLLVAPGSHLHGAVLHYGNEAQVSEERWRNESPTAMALPPGGAIAFHPYLLHSSGPNHSDRSRRALTLRYVKSEPA
ncbi:hypothetical protein FDG2_3357 [Candidatus Protofrankia californiensis]|uniref:Phytanoyl-CoA dioxygenase n=1 Tax=Candidatus Protofrankia californiensis TaxID=1839754 RepID=A0A1C3NZK7_9ACTN|nr:hypothetical protein FDG2_3357 [Candidatus Protofrankia californiensis]